VQRRGRTGQRLVVVALIAAMLAAVLAVIAACGESLDPTTSTPNDGTEAGPDGTTPPGDDGGLTSDGNADDAACVGKDLTSDLRNCGACGHDCKFGACTNGICQPWTVTTSLAGLIFGVDVDNGGEFVFYGSGLDVYRVQTDGGAQERMTNPSLTSGATAITRTSVGMLVCTGNGVFQISPNPGAAIQQFAEIPNCNGIVGDGTTIWVTSASTIWEIRTQPFPQSFPRPAFGFPNQPSGDIDVTPTDVYFLTDQNGVRRFAKNAIDASLPVAAVGQPRGIAIIGDSAYVSSRLPRQIARVDLRDGGVTPLFDFEAGPNPNHVARAPNGSAIYYALGNVVVGWVP
jgi:hypothetical protein